MHDNSSTFTVQISTFSAFSRQQGVSIGKWVIMSSNCTSKCTRDGVWDPWGTQFCSFFFFFLFPSFPACLCFLPHQTPPFSLLYWPVMSTPWHPPLLQTAKLKPLDLAALISQQKEQIWWPKPDSLHCLSANLHLLSSIVTVSYQRKNLTFYWCFLNNCFQKMHENVSTWK